jgi:hypothetical protein
VSKVSQELRARLRIQVTLHHCKRISRIEKNIYAALVDTFVAWLSLEKCGTFRHKRNRASGNEGEDGENHLDPDTHADSLRDPVRLCSKQPVDKTDVINKKDAESHAGETRNRGQSPIDLKEFLPCVNQRY